MGSVVWACLPAFDDDPVFCSLLGATRDGEPGGFFDVELADFARAERRYLTNSAILETRLFDRHGGAIRIVDFAPRFRQLGRMFRPSSLVRLIEPTAGAPRIRVRLRPLFDYGATPPAVTHGSNHVRYVGPDSVVRATTNMPVTYLLEEQPFLLEEPLSIILGPDESLSDTVSKLARHFFEETLYYWQDWSRGLNTPFEWQEAVIRAAITLKLSTFEDTGAVIAAMTTSIPESANSGRNWDYRYCWLRDSYFVVHALNRLGATKTMEAFLRYIFSVAASLDGDDLQPVYGISGRTRLEERVVGSLPGYRNMGPVRVGNQAYEQIQNDVYGAIVLAATQAFFDRRLARPGDRALFERMERLGERAAQAFDRPDAGLWEYRGRQRVHSYSSVMCWAACDRIARIATHLALPVRAQHWRKHADRMHASILEHAWNDELGAFTESYDGQDLDASMLLLKELHFLPAEDPRYRATVATIEKHLRRGNHMYRYASPDDFGAPETAFNICTFWFIDALAAVGRTGEARELFEHMLDCRNSLGLLSEDIDADTGELWGNFPQTYSMVGIINAAARLSASWEDAL
jgi:GH15 family glucan-1,4-alpha-glucosidase